nr:endo alpha-1,4 polygalactosaminidase [Microbulbifer rhizosphaerae]
MATDSSDTVVLITDYVFSEDRVDDSYQKNADLGYISFAADQEELDNIPVYPSLPNNRNSNGIEQLSEAKNFLHLTNTQSYSTPQELVNDIGNTDYDLVIIDFFFNGVEYTRSQIEQLKEKSGGERRLLIAYMNIGQADSDRFYWQNSWSSNRPEWLGEADPANSGHFYVEYWEEGWQEIIYGTDNAYLDRIIDAGFDGVYLDRVNAFEHFE